MPACHKLPGMKRAAFKVANGTPSQAADYCKKEGMYWERGLRKKDPGNDASRSNLLQEQLQNVMATMKNGATPTEIMVSFPCVYAKYYRFVNEFSQNQKPAMRENLKVILLYGRPDAGKTFYCYQKSPNLYALPVKSGSTLWFNGYNMEKEVLIDDFAGQFRLDELLRLLDRYPIRTETKGGHTWFAPDVIYLTSNVPWDTWYDYSKRKDSKAALQRRISTFYYCECKEGLYTQQLTDHQFIPLRRDEPVIESADDTDDSSVNLITDDEQ